MLRERKKKKKALSLFWLTDISNVEQEALQKGKKYTNFRAEAIKTNSSEINYRYKISQGIVFLE